jgi:hypothetical protein
VQKALEERLRLRSGFTCHDGASIPVR